MRHYVGSLALLEGVSEEIKLLTNKRRVLRLLTNERRALRLLTNERRALPAEDPLADLGRLLPRPHHEVNQGVAVRAVQSAEYL